MTKSRNKKQTSILMNAIRLFTKQGFATTKVSDISKSLGISVGGIYQYFPSKGSLAKASIRLVTQKLASELRYINNQKKSSREKIESFVTVYFRFMQNNPEMIEYFFRVYLANRELFCEEEDCGFALAQEFVEEMRRLFEEGVESGEFAPCDFHVAFALVCGSLGAMSFLSGERALEEDIDFYRSELSRSLVRSLSSTPGL